MSYSEADRKAFYVDQAKRVEDAKDKSKVDAWLAKNPHIGVLNGNRYYKIVQGEVVKLGAFEN